MSIIVMTMPLPGDRSGPWRRVVVPGCAAPGVVAGPAAPHMRGNRLAG
jgi:hypothetical protein